MIRRWLPILAVGLAALSLLASVGLFLDARDSRSDIVRAICESRNAERAVHRSGLTDEINQTERIPAKAFEPFGTSKAEALSQQLNRRNRLANVDCDARVRALVRALGRGPTTPPEEN